MIEILLFLANLLLFVVSAVVLVLVSINIWHLRERCEDCGAAPLRLITKTDHHGGLKTVCRDRAACHDRSPG